VSGPATNGLGGKRVLVIEDDYYLATDEAAALQDAGATVVACTGDPEEARILIDQQLINCALVDINLGFGPAFDTARALRDRQIPFLFTTGYDAAAIPPEFGEVPRLEKPFEQYKMIRMLERLV
jgi:DNA-binding NtrC family response regulator